MVSLTHIAGWMPMAIAETDSATGPEPKRRGGPVFIHDAIVPWQGETLLLSMLREQALNAEDDQS